MLKIIRTEGSTPSSSETENLRGATLANIQCRADARNAQMRRGVGRVLVRCCRVLEARVQVLSISVSRERQQTKFWGPHQCKLVQRSVEIRQRLDPTPWKIGHAKTLFRSF